MTGNARPGAGAFSVADLRRADDVAAFGQYGVKRWDEVWQTVIGKAAVGAGHFAVADPRHDGPAKFSNVYRVIAWNKHVSAVNSSRDVAIADPRQQDGMSHSAFKFVPWDSPSKAITGQHAPSNGAMCVADPRPTSAHEGRGKYKVTDWDGQTGAVISASTTGNGAFAVADPRPNLQREHRVARHCRSARANPMGKTLLLVWSGESFMLSALPIWVRPIGAGMSVDQARQQEEL